jgi:fructokinase
MHADRLARALAHVVNLLGPDVIVLGGGVSNVESLYTAVPPLLARYVYRKEIGTPLLRAMHGDASGVRGAAMLWDRG